MDPIRNSIGKKLRTNNRKTTCRQRHHQQRL